MHGKEFIADCIRTFFTVVTLINIAMFLMGITMMPDVKFGYEGFIIPVIYGLAGTIPNLAIHMNRNVNKGIELNKQKDMLPLADIVSEQLGNTGFTDRLAEKTGVQKEDILDYEMYIYQWEKGGYVGFDKTLYSSQRLDNITSVCACT